MFPFNYLSNTLLDALLWTLISSPLSEDCIKISSQKCQFQWFILNKKFVKSISYNLKSKKKKGGMNQYLTPLKENNQSSHRQSKTLTQPREGDWVCYNCQNLNFSFRKKCNRCKVQTKEQNQQFTNYYYNYYPQECYYQEEKENFPSLQNTPHQPSFPSQKTQQKIALKNTEEPEYRKCQQTPQRSRGKDELPSVSPLVKRYNRHENHSTQESKGKGLFEDDCLWANIDLKWLEDSQKEPQEEICQIPEEIEEIQRIIERIIL